MTEPDWLRRRKAIEQGKSIVNTLLGLLMLIGMATCTYQLSTDEAQCRDHQRHVDKYQACRDDPDCQLDWKALQHERTEQRQVRRYCEGL